MASTTTTSSSSLFLLIISLAFSLLSLLYSTIDSSGNNDHLLVHILGFKDLFPRDLDPNMSSERDLLTGISFGSAGCVLSRVMEMSSRQFKLFEEAVTVISKQAGEDGARNIINNGLLFVISVGTNDVMYDGYLLPLKEIQYSDNSSYQNFLIQIMNSNTIIQCRMPRPLFVTSLAKPSKDGQCCGTGLVEMGPTCDTSPTCSDPSKFMFWEARKDHAPQTLLPHVMR